MLPADSSALASARIGTRSKNSPALPRISVRRESNGDHATPTRGETLLVSVLMVSRNCRSYRSPRFSVIRGVVSIHPAGTLRGSGSFARPRLRRTSV